LANSKDNSDAAKRRGLRELALGAGARGARVAGMLAKVAGRSLLSKLPGGQGQDERIADLMLETFGDLKGGYMKLGQIVSYVDPDLSDQARKRLQQLCLSVKPMEWAVLKRVIEEDFGKPVEAVFPKLSPQPVAAASIGQVHRGALPDGTDVAIKLQYPEIAHALDNDLEGMRVIGAVADLFSGIEPEVVMRELEQRFKEECDYKLEARNQETFYRLLQDEPGVRVPRVFGQTSTGRVLATEWMDGRPFEAFEQSRPAEVREKMGLRLFTLTYRLLLEYGLFHADPHPGNYLFGAEDELILLDFGCVKRCSAEFVDAWKMMVQALYENDRAKHRQGVIRSGFVVQERKFDFNHFWNVSQVLYRPLLSRTPFQYTHAYVKECNRVQTRQNPNAMQTRLPADWVFVSRLQWGLHSVLVRLGTRAVFRDVVEPLFYAKTQPLDEAALRTRPRAPSATGA